MGNINASVDLRREGDVAVITVDNPPVNALKHEVRAGLVEALRQADADAGARAIVLACAGRTFSAGADITEFGKPSQSPTLGEVLVAVEAPGKPVVAALHGTTLGGGFELALACHARVAAPGGKVGLPEVKLGILPGAGGTQRLPRLVGPAKAMEMIVTGEPIGVEEAHRAGAVDAIVEGDLLAAAIAYARGLEGKPTLARDRDEKLGEARADPASLDGAAEALTRRSRGERAPQSCVEAVRAAVTLPFEEGLGRERELFMDLVSGDQSKARRYVFFAERQAAKIPDVPADTPTLPIRKVGVIGAGTMGGGISMNFLSAGIPVTIVETKQEALERGLSIIRRNYENTAKKGRLTQGDVETRMGLLSNGLDLEALADCDLVIEAVFENMDLKKEIFAKLDAIVKEGAILASNTSYLDVDAIAAVTKRPSHVLGMHFFSPANVMRLLEVVRGDKTDKSVIATAMAVGRKVGKIPVLVGVCHGFVGNRMLEQRQREAGRLILEGAMPWDVDRVLTAFGLPMGPFAMSDLAGLDIGWLKETSDPDRPRDVLCAMDRRGQKTGAGFYDYDANRKATPSPVAEKVILDIAARKGVARRAIGDQEILERCLYPMINEGAKILEEGIAIRASDIDVVWINGYGWPAWRGGPMHYADGVGLPAIRDALARYAEATGEPDLMPAPLLTRLAEEGAGFGGLGAGAEKRAA